MKKLFASAIIVLVFSSVIFGGDEPPRRLYSEDGYEFQSWDEYLQSENSAPQDYSLMQTQALSESEPWVLVPGDFDNIRDAVFSGHHKIELIGGMVYDVGYLALQGGNFHFRKAIRGWYDYFLPIKPIIVGQIFREYPGLLSFQNIWFVYLTQAASRWAWNDAAIIADLGSELKMVSCRVYFNRTGVSGNYNSKVQISGNTFINLSDSSQKENTTGIILSHQNRVNDQKTKGVYVHNNTFVNPEVGTDLYENYSEPDLSGPWMVGGHDSNRYFYVEYPLLQRKDRAQFDFQDPMLMVRNVTKNQSWEFETIAEPGNVVEFSIHVRNTSPDWAGRNVNIGVHDYGQGENGKEQFIAYVFADRTPWQTSVNVGPRVYITYPVGSTLVYAIDTLEVTFGRTTYTLTGSPLEGQTVNVGGLEAEDSLELRFRMLVY